LVAPLLVATVVAGGPARVAIVEITSALVVLRAEAVAALVFAVVMARVIVGVDEELAAIAKITVVNVRVPTSFVTRALVAVEAVA